jgi:hypothetical protein
VALLDQAQGFREGVSLEGGAHISRTKGEAVRGLAFRLAILEIVLWSCTFQGGASRGAGTHFRY